MPEIEVGTVSAFFARPVVAGIDLTGEVRVGDTLRIRGHTTDLEVRIESMQVDRQDVAVANAGQSVGIKIPDRVRPGDRVYKVVP